MRKSIHSPEYRRVLTKLVEMRKHAGLTQRDLARKLGREHSFVWRIETGERRLDVIEFYWVCEALGQHAPDVYAQLIESIEATDRALPPDDNATSQPKAAEPKPIYRVRGRSF